MARILPGVLTLVGTLLLGAALIFPTYVHPRVAKAPIDQYSQSVAAGEGSYFNLELREPVGPTAILSTSTTRGDLEASGSDVVVYDRFSVTEDAGEVGGTITAEESRVALDRSNSRAVDCCDADELEGLVLKFPFGTEEGATYQFWDGTIGDTLPVEFVRIDEIDGLTVYRFEQVIEPTVIDQLSIPASFVGGEAGDPDVEADQVYENEKYFLVEPVTGQIVDGGQKLRRTVRTGDGTEAIVLADFDLALTDETVAANVDSARSNADQLTLVASTIPLWGGILGVLLTAAGVLLGLRARRPE
ncbi:MAG: DUF3068 domain-containing protein [Nitriliruptorales bacterium]|nr:DUF3068 domain-containing protein [Nitriliruptorales bacterium]